MTYLSYSELEVDRPLEAVSYDVTPEAVELFRRGTLDEVSPREAVDAHGSQREAAPLMLAAAYVRKVYRSLPNPPGGIHAKQRYVFHSPVFCGDVLTTAGRISDLYVKRGNNYVVVESSTTNQDGLLVTSAWATRIWAE